MPDSSVSNDIKYHSDVVNLSYVLHLIDDINPIIDRVKNLLAPGGLFISSTACLGDMNLILKATMSFLLKTGLIPELALFKGSELSDMIRKNDFEIIDEIEIKK